MRTKREVNPEELQYKALLNVTEFCFYMGIGKTKARKLLQDPSTPYAIKLGGEWYANKMVLDKWIKQHTG